jgi:hypothetical protein
MCDFHSVQILISDKHLCPSYRAPEQSSAHGISRLMQTLYAILTRPDKRDTLYFMI